MTSMSCPAEITSSILRGDIKNSVCALSPSFAGALFSKHALSQLTLAQSSDLISDAFWDSKSKLTLQALDDMAAPVRPLVLIMHNLVDSQTIHRLEKERSEDLNVEKNYSMFSCNSLADSAAIPDSHLLLLLRCNLLLLKLASLAESAKKIPEGTVFSLSATWKALDVLWHVTNQVVTSCQSDQVSKAEMEERQHLSVLLVQLCAPFLQQFVKQTDIRADLCCKLLCSLLIIKGPSRNVTATALFKAGEHLLFHLHSNFCRQQ